ncbi:MAG: hypothetical protein AB7F86_09560 [Bdellovibrionales bacterium]
MKSFALLMTLVLANSAYAYEKLTCAFTEPFLTVTFDRDANKVEVHDAIENVIKTYTVTRFEFGEPSVVEWTYEDGQPGSLKYKYAENGASDGMSDIIYRFEGSVDLGSDHRHEHIGGCSTDSYPSIFPDEAPFPGCYYVLQGSFEDGASFYKAVADQILTPLKAKPETVGLAKFLETGIVIDGQMDLSLNICRWIDAAVK